MRVPHPNSNPHLILRGEIRHLAIHVVRPRINTPPHSLALVSAGASLCRTARGIWQERIPELRLVRMELRKLAESMGWDDEVLAKS